EVGLHGSDLDAGLVSVGGLLDAQVGLHLLEHASHDLADVRFVVHDENRAGLGGSGEEGLVDRDVVLLQELPEVLRADAVVTTGGRERAQLPGLDPLQHAVVRHGAVARDLRGREEAPSGLRLTAHTRNPRYPAYAFQLFPPCRGRNIGFDLGTRKRAPIGPVCRGSLTPEMAGCYHPASFLRVFCALSACIGGTLAPLVRRTAYATPSLGGRCS